MMLHRWALVLVNFVSALERDTAQCEGQSAKQLDVARSYVWNHRLAERYDVII